MITLRATVCFVLAALAAPAAASAADNPFHTSALTSRVAETPYPGQARSIGSAANGCLAGAAAMPVSGPGWETLRLERNRFWGNPALVAFIQDMAARTAPLGRLLIGDMAQPRGGHMVSGHGSHQTGVDVDILYRLAGQPLTDDERTSPASDSFVTEAGTVDPARWGQAQVALVKTFASDPRVERIFVNPVIKQALCQVAGDDRAWLGKLRPWWGHDDHFHVRIQCPAGDSECVGGAPLPAGDGCGEELQTWITSGDWHGRPKKHGVPHIPEMPEACRAILSTD